MPRTAASAIVPPMTVRAVPPRAATTARSRRRSSTLRATVSYTRTTAMPMPNTLSMLKRGRNPLRTTVAPGGGSVDVSTPFQPPTAFSRRGRSSLTWVPGDGWM